jgi:hypothetical protein
VHDGAAYSRFGKLRAMQDWSFIRPLLRSCWTHPNGLQNCGRCNKCRRTMMILDALGVLPDFVTFPPIRSSRYFLFTHYTLPHEWLCARQTLRYATSHGRRGLAWIVRMTMARSFFRKLRKRLKESVRSLASSFRISRQD